MTSPATDAARPSVSSPSLPYMQIEMAMVGLS